MDTALEVVVLRAADVDRAAVCSADRHGLDVDVTADEVYRGRARPARCSIASAPISPPPPRIRARDRI